MLLMSIAFHLRAQVRRDSCTFRKKMLSGVWQQSSPVGSGLCQKFEFHADITFVLNLRHAPDPTREHLLS